MTATSVSKGNMNNFLKRIVTLLEEVRDELQELNAYNRKQEKAAEEELPRPRGSKGYVNDSLRK